MESVVDSSAIVCVMLHEPDAPVYSQALSVAKSPLISAFTLFETKTVLQSRKGQAPLAVLDRILARMEARIIAFDFDQIEHALAAYKLYGKGSGHRARLNLGDCASYALASSRGLPLLYKGDDFAATDIRPALPLLLPHGRGNA